MSAAGAGLRTEGGPDPQEACLSGSTGPPSRSRRRNPAVSGRRWLPRDRGIRECRPAREGQRGEGRRRDRRERQGHRRDPERERRGHARDQQRRLQAAAARHAGDDQAGVAVRHRQPVRRSPPRAGERRRHRRRRRDRHGSDRHRGRARPDLRPLRRADACGVAGLLQGIRRDVARPWQGAAPGRPLPESRAQHRQSPVPGAHP